MLAIFTTVFIDMLGFSILIPVYPLLISPDSPFRVTPESWSFGQGLIMLGWLIGIFPLCSFLAAPILGQMSDRYGRRPVLAISIFGTAIGYAIFAIGISTANIPLLFIGRAMDGVTGGNQAVAQAAIGDISNNIWVVASANRIKASTVYSTLQIGLVLQLRFGLPLFCRCLIAF
jgi:MFS transporter, DHA1 family, tetracycline resistance protein